MGRHYFSWCYFASSVYRYSVTPVSSIFGATNAFSSTPIAHLNHPHRRHGRHFASDNHSTSSITASGGGSETSSTSMWDPKSQTYTGGTVPSHHTAIDIDDLLALNDGKLKIFGYGSLCWHPGSDGVLSLANIQKDDHDHDIESAHEDLNVDSVNLASNDSEAASRAKRKVTTAPGRAIGYQRCWSQRSADHRGTTQFNGIVCTLLSDEEVWRLRSNLPHSANDVKAIEENGTHHHPPSMTEGLIYTVDVDLVDDCLAELDFREKGGYARDVIDVMEDDTGNVVKALLYRGTPDNPAFWKRALLDLPLAAAVMSVAVGPSGPNDVYLFHLHAFLTHAAQHSSAAARSLGDHSGDEHTGELANLVKLCQTKYRPYFLFGSGSNDHNQLLLKSDSTNNGAIDGLEGVEEVDEMTEMLLAVPRQMTNDADEEEQSTQNENHDPKSLHAGGGHSALLTHGGDLYLWGWNDAGQLGRALASSESTNTSSSLNLVQTLSNIKVEVVDLGHTHSLVIEKVTGRLFGFGENGRGQVSGCANGNATISDACHVPLNPKCLSGEHFVDVAAGLFHSAAVTEHGELLTWGCSRFGQCLNPLEAASQFDGEVSTVGKWRPPDGSRLLQVTCGRRHTVVLDEHGRVWTMGDNKYGQLGLGEQNTSVTEPQLVDGPLGRVDSGCFAICSGWSHILALTRQKNSPDVTLYGWGRNDKRQLGTTTSGQCSMLSPQMLKPVETPSDESGLSIQSVCCGAESSHVLDTDGSIYSTGWNEHGNLAIGWKGEERGCDDLCLSWMATSGVSVVAPPPRNLEKKLFTSGGAHLIVMAI